MTASCYESAPQAKREAAFSRDSFRCQLCGQLSRKKGGTVDIEAHHKIPPADGGTHDVDNLITLCRDHHRWYHSLARLENIGVKFGNLSYEPSPHDLMIILAIGKLGPSKTGTIADAVGITHEATIQRLYKLTALDVVVPTADLLEPKSDGYWDFRGNIDNPAIGKLPDDPTEAARLVRDEMLREMCDSGNTQYGLARKYGISRRTVIKGIDRARALKPPLPSITDTMTDTHPDDETQLSRED